MGETGGKGLWSTSCCVPIHENLQKKLHGLETLPQFSFERPAFFLSRHPTTPHPHLQGLWSTSCCVPIHENLQKKLHGLETLYRGSLNHLQIPISISVFRQWEQRLSGPGGGGLLTTQNNHLDSIKRGKGDSDSLDQAIDLSICTQSAMTPSTKVATHLPLLLEVRTAIHIRISIDSYLGKYRKDHVP